MEVIPKNQFRTNQIIDEFSLRVLRSKKFKSEEESFGRSIQDIDTGISGQIRLIENRAKKELPK